MEFVLNFRGRNFVVGGKDVLIGRGPSCDIVITNNLVSRHHCRVRRSMNRLLVSDLGSQHGTRINGIRLVHGEAPLKVGDRFEVGEVELLVLELSAVEGQKPEALAQLVERAHGARGEAQAIPDLSGLLRPSDESVSVHRIAEYNAVPNLAPLLSPADESGDLHRLEEQELGVLSRVPLVSQGKKPQRAERKLEPGLTRPTPDTMAAQGTRARGVPERKSERR